MLLILALSFSGIFSTTVPVTVENKEVKLDAFQTYCLTDTFAVSDHGGQSQLIAVSSVSPDDRQNWLYGAEVLEAALR
jgi:hypothetical protein